LRVQLSLGIACLSVVPRQPVPPALTGLLPDTQQILCLTLRKEGLHISNRSRVLTRREHYYFLPPASSEKADLASKLRRGWIDWGPPGWSINPKLQCLARNLWPSSYVMLESTLERGFPFPGSQSYLLVPRAEPAAQLASGHNVLS